jgi:flavodoxin
VIDEFSDHMQTAIIYASIHHGNTRRIAEAMAGALGAELLPVEQAAALEPVPELVGFGSGIYVGRHHELLFEVVRNLTVMPKHSFVFSTAGISSLSSLWHRSLVAELRRGGSEVVGQFCCPGWDTVGPLRLFGGLHRGRPNESDLTRAIQFAHDLRAKIESRYADVT